VCEYIRWLSYYYIFQIYSVFGKMKYCSMASMKLVINMIWHRYRSVRYIIVENVSICDVTTQFGIVSYIIYALIRSFLLTRMFKM